MARPLGDEMNQLRLTPGTDGEPDETARLHELQAGSEEAFNWLVATFAPPVYRLSCRLLNDPADASDVVQEVFLRVFRSIGHFQGHCSLKTWIYHIAVNTVWNQNRWWHRHREQERALEVRDDDAGFEEMPVVDETQNPLASALTLESQEMVWKALLRVNETHRMILVLREMEDLSYDEVAEVLGLTAGTVKSRLARARLALKRELEAMLEPVPRTEPVWHPAK
jgi:RNA polymerase sigma-70 factor (ECF subfamily)